MNDVITADTSRMANVEELMKILMVVNMLNERQQINILINHIAETEKNHAAVMQELADIKEQMNEILSRSENPSGISKIMEQANGVVETQRQRLQGIKQDLNQKAQHVVQNFKNTGIKALNNVCGFLGIQEKLVAMRDQARSAEMDMKIAVEKIDAVEKELSGAVSHLGNVGRVLSGRDKSISENSMKNQKVGKVPALFKMLRDHHQKRQNAYAKRVEKLNGAISRCQALEHKASVLEKLSENKERVAANDKNMEGSRTALATEHKRDENIR